jgi:D-glycero-D-manno-heptose 1,7-bisphosphate phosphatase
VRPAVFLDRDGTLIEDPGHLGDPDGVRLIDGAIDSVRRLSDGGFALVVVSNQAGVARGLFTEEAVVAVNRRIAKLLGEHSSKVEGWYWCPHHPDFTGPCDCRKPAPGMLVDAARDLDLDLTRSWLVGDHGSDVEAARRAGARPIMVRTGHGSDEARSLPPGDATPVVADLAAAASMILAAPGPAD